MYHKQQNHLRIEASRTRKGQNTKHPTSNIPNDSHRHPQPQHHLIFHAVTPSEQAAHEYRRKKPSDLGGGFQCSYKAIALPHSPQRETGITPATAEGRNSLRQRTSFVAQWSFVFPVFKNSTTKALPSHPYRISGSPRQMSTISTRASLNSSSSSRSQDRKHCLRKRNDEPRVCNSTTEARQSNKHRGKAFYNDGW